MGLVLGWGWGRAVPAGGWRLWGAEAGRSAGGFESGLRKNGRYYLQRRRYKVLSALLALSDERSEEFKPFRQHFIPAALLVIPHFPDGTHKTPGPPASHPPPKPPTPAGTARPKTSPIRLWFTTYPPLKKNIRNLRYGFVDFLGYIIYNLSIRLS